MGYLQLLILENINENERFYWITDAIQDDIFDLDFYFDCITNQIKRKIDPITTNTINKVSSSLVDSNKELYSQCVSGFLNYTLPKTNKNDFYHESLDRMKEVLENYLTLYHDGCKLNDKKLVDILLDNKDNDIKSVLNYIIKNIHHNQGERSNLNEKEYNYIWLEINKIIYLVQKYKK